MTFANPTIAFRGAVARAMHEAYKRKHPEQDISGTFPCPHCHSPVQFTTRPCGTSRGQCLTSGCVRWAV